jgi:putative DNA primase/helicase
MGAIERIPVEPNYSYEEFITKLGLNIVKGRGKKQAVILEPELCDTARPQVVAEGGRNTALTSLAGSLRRRGVAADLIRSILLTQNELMCKPPLPTDEVERISSSVARYEPQLGGDLTSTLTDTGNAERFEQNWKDRIRYIPSWKKWLLWDGTRWVKDDSNLIMELAKETARRIYEEGVGLTDDKLRISIAKHSAKSQQAERLKAMINLATSIPSLVVLASQLDADPMLLGVANGVLDLRTGKLRPAEPKDLITKQAPVQFDPGAKCQKFETFVREVMNEDEELIAYLRRVAGYCLTGLTDEQCLFFFYGAGANGKSTFLNVLKDVLGDDYCKQTPSDTLMVKKNGRNATNDIARLVGVRSVLSNEVEEGSRLSESFIKEMTGGDPISARFLFAEFFDFRPQFKIIIAGNHQPVIRGDDTGIWRRLHLVPFTVTIPAEKRNPKLSEALRAELPGILNWGLAGCLEWQQGRLSPPKVVTDAVSEYRSEMDVLGQWIEANCILGADKTTGAMTAYENYAQWARSNGFMQMTSNAFGRRLKERFVRKATGTGKVYIGLEPKRA